MSATSFCQFSFLATSCPAMLCSVYAKKILSALPSSTPFKVSATASQFVCPFIPSDSSMVWAVDPQQPLQQDYHKMDRDYLSDGTKT